MYDLSRPIVDNFYMSEGISRYYIMRSHAAPSLSPSLHYSNALFEGMSIAGIRRGQSIRLGLFHPALNFERLRYTLAGLDFGWELYSDEQIIESIFTVCALNGWNRAIELEGENTRIHSEHGDYYRIYVRPLVYANNNAIGLRAKQNPELINCLVPMGEYLESTGSEGINTMLFPKPRMLAFPTYKVASNYQLSIYGVHRMGGYNNVSDIKCSEVVFENTLGNITEGSGENIVMLKDNELITPPPSEGALPGITYRIVFLIAEEMGLKARFGTFKYDDVESAECIFLTGNAAGLVPIKKIVKVDENFRMVDYKETKEGGRSSLFTKLKAEYTKVAMGDVTYGNFYTYLDDWIDETRLDELNNLGAAFREQLQLENQRYDGSNSEVSSFLQMIPKVSVARHYFDDKKWMLERLSIKHYLK